MFVCQLRCDSCHPVRLLHNNYAYTYIWLPGQQKRARTLPGLSSYPAWTMPEFPFVAPVNHSRVGNKRKSAITSCSHTINTSQPWQLINDRVVRKSCSHELTLRHIIPGLEHEYRKTIAAQLASDSSTNTTSTDDNNIITSILFGRHVFWSTSRTGFAVVATFATAILDVKMFSTILRKTNVGVDYEGRCLTDKQFSHYNWRPYLNVYPVPTNES